MIERAQIVQLSKNHLLAAEEESIYRRFASLLGWKKTSALAVRGRSLGVVGITTDSQRSINDFLIALNEFDERRCKR